MEDEGYWAAETNEFLDPNVAIPIETIHAPKSLGHSNLVLISTLGIMTITLLKRKQKSTPHLE